MASPATFPSAPRSSPLVHLSRERSRRRMARWGLLLVLSGLLNGALLVAFSFLGRLRALPHSPLDVKTVSPQELEAIRNHWKEKKLLLQAKGTETQDPSPDARFESDRAVRVQKEQRARQTDVVPIHSRPKPNQAEKKPEGRLKAPTRLSSLGVPLQFKAPAPPSENNPASANQPTTRSAEQSLAGEDSLPEGSENLLNTQESRFYSFYSRLYEAIGPLWRAEIQQVPRNRKLIPGVYRTVAEITLTPDGDLQGVRILRSAGVPELDQVVISSWRKLARFPNPPKPLWEQTGKVIMNWSFEYNLSNGFEWLPSNSQRL